MKKKFVTGILATAMLLGGASTAFAETENNNSMSSYNWFDSSISGVISDYFSDTDWFQSYGCGHMDVDALGLTGDVRLDVYYDYGVRFATYDTVMDEETGTLDCGFWYFRISGDTGADYTLSWR